MAIPPRHPGRFTSQAHAAACTTPAGAWMGAGRCTVCGWPFKIKLPPAVGRGTKLPDSGRHDTARAALAAAEDAGDNWAMTWAPHVLILVTASLSSRFICRQPDAHRLQRLGSLRRDGTLRPAGLTRNVHPLGATAGLGRWCDAGGHDRYCQAPGARCR